MPTQQKPASRPSVPVKSTAAQLKQMRTIAHSLHPIITIAQKGLTENISKELSRALDQHELIKIKILASDRQERRALTETICEQTGAELVQSIGNVVVLFRAASKQDPKLSNIVRFKPQ